MLNESAIWKSLTAPDRLIVIAERCVIEKGEIRLWIGAALQKPYGQLDNLSSR